MLSMINVIKFGRLVTDWSIENITPDVTLYETMLVYRYEI